MSTAKEAQEADIVFQRTSDGTAWRCIKNRYGRASSARQDTMSERQKEALIERLREARPDLKVAIRFA